MSLEESAGALAGIFEGYRRSEGVMVDQDSILRWVYQFEDTVRSPLLQGMRALYSQTYIDEGRCDGFLRRILLSEKLTGGDPRGYWAETRLLRNQMRGSSQRELIRKFELLARTEFGEGFSFGGDRAGRSFYLDDFLLSGGRVKEDFGRWIEGELPGQKHHLDLGFFATHAFGAYSFDRFAAERIHQLLLRSKVTYKVRRCDSYENRRARRNSSEVFWPSITAEDVGFGELQGMNHVLRSGAGGDGKYWSVESRRLMEREFLRAGCRIASSIAERKSNVRPLGFYNFGYGFGATCASFMNCPNNAPLAVWWSVPTRGLPDGWIPLLPRRPNEE